MKENLPSARQIGITPLLVRLAWEFAKRGVGTFYIEHKDYDNVVVSEIYSWTVVEGAGQGALRVSFRRGREAIRYVELGAHVVGAGGNPLLEETITRVCPT